eukprot:COSAG01_NODE_3322_length_6257_cov_9.805294_3_plen_102_part_00
MGGVLTDTCQNASQHWFWFSRYPKYASKKVGNFTVGRCQPSVRALGTVLGLRGLAAQGWHDQAAADNRSLSRGSCVEPAVTSVCTAAAAAHTRPHAVAPRA